MNVLKEIEGLPLKAEYHFKCSNCNKDSTRTVKNLRKSVLPTDGKLFCSIGCYSQDLNKDKRSDYSCYNCNKIFSREKSRVTNPVKVYCSSNCAAVVNNSNRKHSEETKQKIKKTLEQLNSDKKPVYSRNCKFCTAKFETEFKTENFCSDNCVLEENLRKEILKACKPKVKRKSKSPYCFIKFVECKECSYIFYHTSNRKHSKFCSETCRKLNVSRAMSERLSKAENRINLGRGKPSWMEKSFSEWLTGYKIPFETEVQFKNHDLGKFYYADFVFSQFSLIIELDGNHHRFTVEKDKIRDEYLKSFYNYDVMRITHKEYKSKSRLDEIKSALGIIELT